jgi:hypothetical protein
MASRACRRYTTGWLAMRFSLIDVLGLLSITQQIGK